MSQRNVCGGVPASTRLRSPSRTHTHTHHILISGDHHNITATFTILVSHNMCMERRTREDNTNPSLSPHASSPFYGLPSVVRRSPPSPTRRESLFRSPCRPPRRGRQRCSAPSCMIIRTWPMPLPPSYTGVSCVCTRVCLVCLGVHGCVLCVWVYTGVSCVSGCTWVCLVCLGVHGCVLCVRWV